MLTVTDLNGRNPTIVSLDFYHCDTLQRGKDSLGSGQENVLTRGHYKVHPRFDFMLGPVFIQVSISDFGSHNTGSADIHKAFDDRDDKGMNQIECYLNDLFGPHHSARIEDNRFVVTRNGEPVPGFRMVYICGSHGNPAHHGWANKAPRCSAYHFQGTQEESFQEHSWSILQGVELKWSRTVLLNGSTQIK